MRRRHFLAASLAALAAPAWAEIGAPRWLSAAARDGDDTHLIGLDATGAVRFALPIPSRGHAAAAHPHRAEAVAFARRPGRFAVVIDCATGCESARLESPKGRHFYGHGAFTEDGALLLTTENDWETPAGVIGVWDAENGYARLGEFSSGGIGPHEIIRLADGAFAVANGGIQTHPDFERAKLNLPQMKPNLTYLDATGAITAQIEPPEAQRLNSVRHLDADKSGQVAIALQWQGDPRARAPLVAIHRRDAEDGLRFLDHPQMARLKHYAGSVAISADGARIAVTGPKGGEALFFDAASGAPDGAAALREVSGAAQHETGFILTRAGGITLIGPDGARAIAAPGWRWDNHLVRI